MSSFTTSRFCIVPAGSKQNRETLADKSSSNTHIPTNANGNQQDGRNGHVPVSPAAHAPSSPLTELSSLDFSSPVAPSPPRKVASPVICDSQPSPPKVLSPSPRGNTLDAIEAVPIRRNPKRVTSTLVTKRPAVEITYPEDILGAALAPMTQEELEEWEGWIELESEPAFFNIILRDLGVRDVKIQEVFALDEAFIQMLPQPVHGLIFCYQYVDDFWDVDDESDTDDVWFANQTVDNACATVAMMNIVMNSPSIPLGDTLQAFKDTTIPMASPLRGHTLSKNKFIRTVHNGFTRRLDHLNADLWLSNDSEKAIKRAKTMKRGKAPPKGRKKKKRSDAGFHFIAYVPVNGSIWELDGLKSRPKKLGPIIASAADPLADWTLQALPHIEMRMAQYDEDFQFNLLALCQSPLADLRRRILEGIRALEMITLRTSGNPEWENKTGTHHAVPWDPIDGAEKLAEFGLRPDMIPTSRLSEPLKSSVASALEFPPSMANDPETHNMADLPPPSESALAAMAQLWAEVAGDVKEAATQYSVEMGSLAEDEINVEGRKRDHTPAIHAWVRKLAEKGVLEQLVK